MDTFPRSVFHELLDMCDWCFDALSPVQYAWPVTRTRQWAVPLGAAQSFSFTLHLSLSCQIVSGTPLSEQLRGRHKAKTLGFRSLLHNFAQQQRCHRNSFRAQLELDPTTSRCPGPPGTPCFRTQPARHPSPYHQEQAGNHRRGQGCQPAERVFAAAGPHRPQSDSSAGGGLGAAEGEFLAVSRPVHPTGTCGPPSWAG